MVVVQLRQKKEIGCPKPPTSNETPPLDFIEFLPKTSTSIYEIVAPLYKKGLSITDIADQTGLKRTSIWSSLRAHKEELRAQAPVPFDRWRKRTGKVNARPPYGFSFFQGEIIKDPKEYPILQLIQNLRKQGLSISSIMLKLNERGSKSRMNKLWSYNVIKSIIKRSKDGTTEYLASNKKSKNKKQNSTEVEDEL